MAFLIGWLVISSAVLLVFSIRPVYSTLKSAVTLSLFVQAVSNFGAWILFTFLFWLATILFLLPAVLSNSPIALVISVIAYMGASYCFGGYLKIEPRLNRILLAGAAPLQGAVILVHRLKKADSK